MILLDATEPNQVFRLEGATTILGQGQRSTARACLISDFIRATNEEKFVILRKFFERMRGTRMFANRHESGMRLAEIRADSCSNLTTIEAVTAAELTVETQSSQNEGEAIAAKSVFHLCSIRGLDQFLLRILHVL